MFLFPLLYVQPMTLAFVYVGTTIKDIADISHGGAHFTRAKVVSKPSPTNCYALTLAYFEKV